MCNIKSNNKAMERQTMITAPEQQRQRRQRAVNVVRYDVTHQEEATLRSSLLQKPNSAKLMSRLACFLVERKRMAVNNNNDDDDKQLQEEAIRLAKRAVELAPRKPYGYMALSIVYGNSSSMEVGHDRERLGALKEAVRILQEEEAFCSTVHWTVVRLALLVRLAVEPRDDESKRLDGTVGRASSNHHPNHRPLTTSEETLYVDEIVPTLQYLWNLPKDDDEQERRSNLSLSQRITVAHQEFKLGKFFRYVHRRSFVI
jgi:hypothetical protein